MFRGLNKWPPFCRWHYSDAFHWMKIFPFWVQLQVWSMDSIDSISGLVQMMVWHWPHGEPLLELTHWGREEMNNISQTTFSYVFSSMKMFEFRLKLKLKFVPKGPINNIPALVQIMAWRRSGDKPLSEPMMVSLPTHIWVTLPQWVNVVPNLCWHMASLGHN